MLIQWHDLKPYIFMRGFYTRVSALMSGIYSQIRVSFAALVIIFLKVNQLGFPTVDLTRVTERAHAQIVASLNKFSGKI